MIGKLKGMFAARPSESSTFRTGVVLQKRFMIQSDISSQGSMSHVYKALDTESGKTICLKVQDRERNEAALARASRHETRPTEGAIAIQVSHPNVIRTLEHGTTTKGEQYIVMEYVNGVDFDRVQEARLGRTADRVEWLAQAADGLAAVHEAGFIHHDVNPRNFLVSREQQIKLIDFGLAVPNTPAFRKPGNRTGCLLFMAPELLRREPIDERIDIFSFGVVAFSLLTERLPFDSPASPNTLLQRFSLPANDPAKLRPKLSDEICEVLRSLIAVDKRERWPQMATLSERLRSIPPKRTAR
jgi:eukaryotic-like serine/threonine-protein kinase